MSSDVVPVIDDEPQIRRVVRHALERDVARVVEAAGGREGIDAAAAERPALIVLDLGLPDMNGIDVCREIRHWSSAPIVVLSARHSDREKVMLLDAGAVNLRNCPGVSRQTSCVAIVSSSRLSAPRSRSTSGLRVCSIRAGARAAFVG